MPRKVLANLISCIVSSNNAYEDYWSAREVNGLPRLALDTCLVTHQFPIPVVHRYFYVVAVGSVITVPEQQPGKEGISE